MYAAPASLLDDPRLVEWLSPPTVATVVQYADAN
jgi:hypothetical protein